jgi:ABC-type transport system substrate-binding protein
MLMNDTEWVLVYSSNNYYQAEIVKQMLDSNGINVSLINKQDSSYLTFGDIEVYVESESVSIAKKLIEGFEI